MRCVPTPRKRSGTCSSSSRFSPRTGARSWPRSQIRSPSALLCAFAAGVLELQESRPRLERLRDDDALLENWWTVGQEAEWALRCLDGEVHPPLPDRV